jgi:hypothetical protein
MPLPAAKEQIGSNVVELNQRVPGMSRPLHPRSQHAVRARRPQRSQPAQQSQPKIGKVPNPPLQTTREGRAVPTRADGGSSQVASVAPEHTRKRNNS